jgi:hypothetical protein
MNMRVRARYNVVNQDADVVSDVTVFHPEAVFDNVIKSMKQ